MKGKARVGGMLWNLDIDRWQILGLSLLRSEEVSPVSYLGSSTQPVAFPDHQSMSH